MQHQKLTRLLLAPVLVSGLSVVGLSVAAAASKHPSHLGHPKHKTSKPVTVQKTYHLSGSFSFVSGYSFKVSAQTTVGAPMPADDTKLPPGYDGVVIPIKGSADVDNTTSGREYSGQALTSSEIITLYKEPSPMCPTTGTKRTHVFYYLNSTAYCNGPSLTVQETGTGGMLANHPYPLQVRSGTCLTAITVTPLTPSPGYCESITTKTGEDAIDTRSSNYPSVLKTLAHPPDLVLWVVRGEGEATLTGQTTVPKGDYCHPDPTFPTDWWVLASSEPITSCGVTFTVGQMGTFQIMPISGTSLSNHALTLSGNPTWLSITATTGVLTGTPPMGAEGIITFSILTANTADTVGPTSETFTITVAPLALLVPPAVTLGGHA